MKLSSRYQTRPIRFLELWQARIWRMKVYGIAFDRATPRADLVSAAKAVAEKHLPMGPTPYTHYNVGFVGVHDGRTANFMFVDWWADENELHHHVYVSPTDDPARLAYMTPSGLAACVWDLRVLAFERQAWLDTILKNPRGPDLDAYLQQRLNEDA